MYIHRRVHACVHVISLSLSLSQPQEELSYIPSACQYDLQTLQRSPQVEWPLKVLTESDLPDQAVRVHRWAHLGSGYVGVSKHQGPYSMDPK